MELGERDRDRELPGALQLGVRASGRRGSPRGASACAPRCFSPRRKVRLRPTARLPCAAVPPLITPEEARQLGEIEDHARDRGARRAGLEGARRALRRLHRHVLAGERQVRRVRGGLRVLRPVALRRGRHADARDDDPGADPRARRARPRPRARTASAWSPRARASRRRTSRRSSRAPGWWPSETNLKRCASVGHMSVKRAQQLKDAGIQRVHHNVETAESYYDEVSTTVRYEGRLRTIDAVSEAGLETCVGGILNLGETREQRVEMAFELAKIDPTSVPINMLNPRPGTKFGDREYMDPWEAVKWIAIFRLDPPGGAVPPLRRPRREPRRPAPDGREGRHQRGDDGQLPHHAGLRARGRPRDVRGARAQRRAPARQRREPAARQPLRAGSTATPRPRRSTS